MANHADYRFSVTIATDDEAVLNCLRALSQFAQAHGNARIPWGGTKKQDWEQAGHHATFRFSSPEYRADFLTEIDRLLPRNLSRVERQNDNDPASPQNED